MDNESHNRFAADEWATSILQFGLSRGGGRQVRLPARVPPFRFYAITPLVPINDKIWDMVVSDQRSIAAHEIISALWRRGYRCHSDNADQQSGSLFIEVNLPEVVVEVDYGNITGDDDSVYKVLFELHLHVRREVSVQHDLRDVTVS